MRGRCSQNSMTKTLKTCFTKSSITGVSTKSTELGKKNILSVWIKTRTRAAPRHQRCQSTQYQAKQLPRLKGIPIPVKLQKGSMALDSSQDWNKTTLEWPARNSLIPKSIEVNLLNLRKQPQDNIKKLLVIKLVKHFMLLIINRSSHSRMPPR